MSNHGLVIVRKKELNSPSGIQGTKKNEGDVIGKIDCHTGQEITPWQPLSHKVIDTPLTAIAKAGNPHPW